MASLTAALLISLSGCAGLPEKSSPVVLASEAPLSDFGDTAGGSWPDKQWWRHYQDTTLDALVDMALAASPTLATAHNRVDTARESVRIAGAASGAQVGVTGDAQRQRLSDNGIASLFPPQLLSFHWYNEFDLGLQASYTFDWWGKQRAVVESAVDQAHATQAERSAAALVLTSSVAGTYFAWQADQTRLSLAQQRLATVQREAAIQGERIKAELESADTLHRSETVLAAIKEQIAQLEGSARLRIVALAALVGRPSTQLPRLTPKPLPAVQASVPDDVRLDLIARRADIIASRWRVEAAEKTLASARAEFYPDVSINALGILNSLTASHLLEYGSRAPDAGVAVHLPLFDSGRLKARYRATQLQIDAAVAAYNETVVEAARDVATQAATRGQASAERAQRAVQVQAAEDLRSSAAARVRQGLADIRTELQATETLIEERDALLQLDFAVLSADIGLERALGGGYELPAKLAASATPTK